MPEPRARFPRRAVGRVGATAAAVVLTLALAGCSGDDADEAVGPKPDLPTTVPALWNPCTALDLDRVEALLDATLTQDVGTDDDPVCHFVPDDDGGAAVDVNYQLFDGDMDQLIASFGIASDAPGTDEQTGVEELDVPRADGARLVSLVQDGTLTFTGFVQNGDLVQLVNVLDPQPFDRPRLKAAVAAMLGDLAARADESGLSD